MQVVALFFLLLPYSSIFFAAENKKIDDHAIVIQHIQFLRSDLDLHLHNALDCMYQSTFKVADNSYKNDFPEKNQVELLQPFWITSQENFNKFFTGDSKFVRELDDAQITLKSLSSISTKLQHYLITEAFQSSFELMLSLINQIKFGNRSKQKVSFIQDQPKARVRSYKKRFLYLCDLLTMEQSLFDRLYYIKKSKQNSFKSLFEQFLQASKKFKETPIISRNIFAYKQTVLENIAIILESKEIIGSYTEQYPYLQEILPLVQAIKQDLEVPVNINDLEEQQKNFNTYEVLAIWERFNIDYNNKQFLHTTIPFTIIPSANRILFTKKLTEIINYEGPYTIHNRLYAGIAEYSYSTLFHKIPTQQSCAQSIYNQTIKFFDFGNNTTQTTLNTFQKTITEEMIAQVITVISTLLQTRSALIHTGTGILETLLTTPSIRPIFKKIINKSPALAEQVILLEDLLSKGIKPTLLMKLINCCVGNKSLDLLGQLLISMESKAPGWLASMLSGHTNKMSDEAKRILYPLMSVLKNNQEQIHINIALHRVLSGINGTNHFLDACSYSIKRDLEIREELFFIPITKKDQSFAMPLENFYKKLFSKALSNFEENRSKTQNIIFQDPVSSLTLFDLDYMYYNTCHYNLFALEFIKTCNQVLQKQRDKQKILTQKADREISIKNAITGQEQKLDDYSCQSSKIADEIKQTTLSLKQTNKNMTALQITPFEQMKHYLSLLIKLFAKIHQKLFWYKIKENDKKSFKKSLLNINIHKKIQEFLVHYQETLLNNNVQTKNNLKKDLKEQSQKDITLKQECIKLNSAIQLNHHQINRQINDLNTELTEARNAKALLPFIKTKINYLQTLINNTQTMI